MTLFRRNMKLQMGCIIFLFLIIASNSVSGINRPVYKVLLTQRGFTQFLQYDVQTPPIREFTFCVWLRFSDLSYEQSISRILNLSDVLAASPLKSANRNNRVVRLWLESGGQYIKLSLSGRPATSILVDITKNTWRHICISYQSDFGTWALYLDGQLISCETTQNLFGNILPAGGSVIIGYGTTETGIRSGLEGEVFGANMILISTIERNYTISKNPQYQQKQLNKNKILIHNYHKYTVLESLSDELRTDGTTTTMLPLYNTSRSFIKLKTPVNEIEHEIGIGDKYQRTVDNSDEKEVIDIRIDNKQDNKQKVRNTNINAFFNAENELNSIKFKEKNENKEKFSNTGNENIPTPPEFEVPPPLTSFGDYIRTNIKLTKPINNPLYYKIDNKKIKPYISDSVLPLYKRTLQDIGIPQSPPKNNLKVYGQSTKSQFANRALNYLKRFNYEYKDQIKVPPTKPDFKLSKVRPSLTEFQKKSFINSNMDINKRVGKQLKIEILEDDLRSHIMESRVRTRPKHKELNYRGHIKGTKTHRSYRNIDAQLTSNGEYSSGILKCLKNNPSKFDPYKGNSFMTMLPFVKTSEYLIDKEEYHTNNRYTRSLSSDDKWYDIKSFNNDPTPRSLSVEWKKTDSDVGKKILEVSKRNSSIKLKYVPENHKVVKVLDSSAILDARALAMEISNLSNLDNFSKYSILKYNQGFLPIKSKFKKSDNSIMPIQENNDDKKNILNKYNLNKTVKIENALNERLVMGYEEQDTPSFIGGNDKIPNIGSYKTDVHTNSEKVPPTLCRNVEINNHRLYVQPDGSVDVTQIWSPIKVKNVGVNFVLQNYKKCSLQESHFQRSPLLLIDWNKTPVRLFGGADPKKTTDLCGFF